MNEFSIGRGKEIAILEKLYASKEAQFLAIYGRRRVGKNYLISNFFKNRGHYFELTGIKDAKTSVQLNTFSEEFARCFFQGKRQEKPKTWQEAFTQLREKIEKIPENEKVILFLDELPWLASNKSGFLQALDHLWNRYLSRCPNVILIVCGSATAWILQKIVNDQGGFYERLTSEIHLLPYTLGETEEFCKAKGIELERKQIVDLYLAFGRVPKYLNYISRGKSSVQIIQEACFDINAPLAQEFNRLFHSLFDEAESHLAIVTALASQRSGLTQKELLSATKLTSGGSFSRTLFELQASGFIAFVPHLGQIKREGKYRLIDEYSLFFLTWMQEAFSGYIKNMPSTYWQQIQNSQEYRTWSGYAFEGICLKHIKSAIEKSLKHLTAFSPQ